MLVGCAALFQELSEEYGFDFDIMTAEIDERSLGDRTKDPEKLVLKLAHAKAQSLIQKLDQTPKTGKQHFLVTCDQVVVSSSGTILEKPLDADEVRYEAHHLTRDTNFPVIKKSTPTLLIG